MNFDLLLQQIDEGKFNKLSDDKLKELKHNTTEVIHACNELHSLIDLCEQLDCDISEASTHDSLVSDQLHFSLLINKQLIEVIDVLN